MADIKTEVLDVISDVFSIPVAELDETMSADDVDGWDSLNHVTLILMLSKKLNVKISPTDTEGAKNIGDLISLVDSLKKK